MTYRFRTIAALLAVVALLAGCSAATQAFNRGDELARMGNWDDAVEAYRRALQEQPDNAEYRIAYERAMISASVAHLDQARVFEVRGQLEEALREYRRASEFDPPNRQLAAKVTEIERKIRDAAEASRPRQTTAQLRDAARAASAPVPLASINTVVGPLRFNQASLRESLNIVAQVAGIDVTYERDYQDRAVSIQLSTVTVGEALTQILSSNQLFYKVVNQRTILVIPDTPQKRQQFEDQVVQTFYLSHSDSNEVSQFLNQILVIPGQQAVGRPTVIPNKTNNSVTARASASMMPLIERLVINQDTPRAEILVDVQILEVSKVRTKQFGLNLSEYALSGVFSPEVDPRADDSRLLTGGELHFVGRRSRCRAASAQVTSTRPSPPRSCGSWRPIRRRK